jgi:hypothetical protein
MGHGAWGMGHGAWGMGHGAWVIILSLSRQFAQVGRAAQATGSPLPKTLFPSSKSPLNNCPMPNNAPTNYYPLAQKFSKSYSNLKYVKKW